MCHGSDTRRERRAAFVMAAFALCACDPSFDTTWRRPSEPADAGGDAGDLDAEPTVPEASTPDASDFDVSVSPLPRIDCSAVVRDASLVKCENDCFQACSARCSDAALGCGDAEVWLQCWQCVDGAAPPK